MIKLGGFKNRIPGAGQSTKKFDRIINILIGMLNGEFNPELDEEWIKKWKLKRNIFGKKYSEKGLKSLLKKAVERYVKMWDENYQPSNKNILTRDFSLWLYDGYNKKSWFMFCLNKKPESSGQIIIRKIKESIPAEDRKPIEEFYRPGFNELIYWKKMYSLYKWWKENKETLYWQNFNESGFDSYFRNWRTYFGYYVEYLKEWRDLSVSQLGVYTTTWHRFNDHIKQTFGYDLFPDEDKARMNKTFHTNEREEEKNEEDEWEC